MKKPKKGLGINFLKANYRAEGERTQGAQINQILGCSLRLLLGDNPSFTLRYFNRHLCLHGSGAHSCTNFHCSDADQYADFSIECVSMGDKWHYWGLGIAQTITGFWSFHFLKSNCRKLEFLVLYCLVFLVVVIFKKFPCCTENRKLW